MIVGCPQVSRGSWIKRAKHANPISPTHPPWLSYLNIFREIISVSVKIGNLGLIVNFEPFLTICWMNSHYLSSYLCIRVCSFCSFFFRTFGHFQMRLLCSDCVLSKVISIIIIFYSLFLLFRLSCSFSFYVFVFVLSLYLYLNWTCISIFIHHHNFLFAVLTFSSFLIFFFQQDSPLHLPPSQRTPTQQCYLSCKCYIYPNCIWFQLEFWFELFKELRHNHVINITQVLFTHCICFQLNSTFFWFQRTSVTT